MNDYWKQMKFDAQDVTNKARKKRFEAYSKAHEIRKFEIELFWKRATYYWAFILAALTAHFALVGMLFREKDFSIPQLYMLPGLSLFALAITAFFCFLFSLCWVLMNKGSKFWQKNWEGHIDMLEREFCGDLYKVILNTKDKINFCGCPLSLKAYDYSVSKITMITSISLLVASFLLYFFYVVLIIIRFQTQFDVCFRCSETIRWEGGICILILLFLQVIFIFAVIKGNAKCENNEWINRSDLVAK